MANRFAFILRKKLTVALLIICVIIFLVIHSPFSSDKEFVIPMYSLTDVSVMDWNRSIKSVLYHPLNQSIEKNSFIYVQSDFQIDSGYVADLQRYNNFLARTLSTEYADFEGGENKTHFGCICGRVSDACICCGQLIPKPTERSYLTPDLYKAVILVPHESKMSEATFCLNVTYLPQTKRIRTSSVLLHFNASVHTKSLQGYKVLMNTTTDPTTVPVFGALHLGVSPLPIICAGNPALPATLDICTHFVSLDYKVMSEFGPKTSFVGCAYVQIVMSRRFIVARFPKFCFQAYQGAVADADSAENALVEKKVDSSQPLPKVEPSLIAPDNSSSKGSPDAAKPVEIKAEPKDIVHPGVFDAHPVP